MKKDPIIPSHLKYFLTNILSCLSCNGVKTSLTDDDILTFKVVPGCKDFVIGFIRCVHGKIVTMRFNGHDNKYHFGEIKNIKEIAYIIAKENNLVCKLIKKGQFANNSKFTCFHLKERMS